MDSGIVRIKVMGIGGAGGNAIDDMISSGVGGVEYIAANTDAQDLHNSLADIRIQLGEELTRGLGAGANPEIGRQAAETDQEKIKTLLEETDMLFVTAGMGGGTGTGAAPIIAGLAKSMGILTVGVVTKPFTFEGRQRIKNALDGLENLKTEVDALVVIPNDKLFELPEKIITFKNAFKEANNILKIGIKGVAELVLQHGLINLDFADLKAVMGNSGIAMLGFGEAEGENRAMRAAEKALKSPLLEKAISGANKILIKITGDQNFGLNEAYAITNLISEEAGKQADDVMFGLALDESFEDKVEITIIATNFENENVETTEKVFTRTPTEKPTIDTDDKDLEIPAWIRRKNT